MKPHFTRRPLQLSSAQLQRIDQDINALRTSINLQASLLADLEEMFQDHSDEDQGESSAANLQAD
ncbi:hypothetical protein [Rubinisphaera margarita]|uniref:hypothetical protein n=1 Tax=Rubinisphaera margarita TaxID=2909586 RepID=UPI001EE803A5|nr:hypothetical protein [Rubinisphaera margarita]MCG6156886.1 hypothetical protein [Rubinisphaera margarita]